MSGREATTTLDPFDAGGSDEAFQGCFVIPEVPGPGQQGTDKVTQLVVPDSQLVMVAALAAAPSGASPTPGPSGAGVHHLFSERVLMRGSRLSSSETRGGVPRRPSNGVMSALTDGWMGPSGKIAVGPCQR